MPSAMLNGRAGSAFFITARMSSVNPRPDMIARYELNTVSMSVIAARPTITE
eukprot:CAMPEP_0119196080 /NCGR_PEP_ID=MMETSP1316-20130426/8493_1 /TAXON_ID=41880 /ORGANISM="Pycnococcus provasolii, Strain RCC2336" /LENGTH=51 /DNA_ID=CAMNT_0007191703 /DNA_START=60 /DNA_END=215 /DNA_ORIENTATION=+